LEYQPARARRAGDARGVEPRCVTRTSSGRNGEPAMSGLPFYCVLGLHVFLTGIRRQHPDFVIPGPAPASSALEPGIHVACAKGEYGFRVRPTNNHMSPRNDEPSDRGHWIRFSLPSAWKAASSPPWKLEFLQR